MEIDRKLYEHFISSVIKITKLSTTNCKMILLRGGVNED